jgi:hypothetical protein
MKAKKKALAAVIDARINRAVVGFQIPMLAIPKLYSMLEALIASGASDDELKVAVAGFPGVEAV